MWILTDILKIDIIVRNLDQGKEIKFIKNNEKLIVIGLKDKHF